MTNVPDEVVPLNTSTESKLNADETSKTKP